MLTDLLFSKRVLERERERERDCEREKEGKGRVNMPFKIYLEKILRERERRLC